ncbi:hypothetical protein [uncultured Litoreibacter sp.]|nr:hypothetical protein [uncultured Litoreibacter sp.]
MRITHSLFAVALAASGLVLAGCAKDLPDTRNTISTAAQDAPYPQLAPLDGLIARSEAGTTIVKQTESFEARVAFLKRKAAALKGRTIIDGATRLKLLQAGQRNARRQPG